MSEPLDILAFSPHPDDAELGCAGSLILAADTGLRVAIADLSEGELSSRGDTTKRKAEKQRATEVMGLSDRISVGLRDTEIGRDPAHRMALIEVIREMRPRIVLSPHWKDRHPDHEAAGRLVREAVFYSGVGNVGKGTPHRPERLFYYMIHHPFTPSFVIEVSSVWERKTAALRAFESQFIGDEMGPQTALSRPEFLQFTEARARWFGAMIGVAYGEPFLSTGPLSLPRFPGAVPETRSKQAVPSYCMFT